MASNCIAHGGGGGSIFGTEDGDQMALLPVSCTNIKSFRSRLTVRSFLSFA
jgi:hypothetical protein